MCDVSGGMSRFVKDCSGMDKGSVDSGFGMTMFFYLHSHSSPKKGLSRAPGELQVPPLRASHSGRDGSFFPDSNSDSANLPSFRIKRERMGYQDCFLAHSSQERA
jgi:hypothetical protein